jgi:hypothetical protein
MNGFGASKVFQYLKWDMFRSHYFRNKNLLNLFITGERETCSLLGYSIPAYAFPNCQSIYMVFTLAAIALFYLLYEPKRVVGGDKCSVLGHC